MRLTGGFRHGLRNFDQPKLEVGAREMLIVRTADPTSDSLTLRHRILLNGLTEYRLMAKGCLVHV